MITLLAAVASSTFTCTQYANYQFGSVTRNDLGGVLAGTVENGAPSTVTPYEIHFSIAGGRPDAVLDLSAGYGRIRQRAGSSSTFLLRKWDTTARKYVQFSEFYMTFYDIDKASDGAQEIVQVHQWDHAWLAQFPEVNMARQDDGSVKFEGEQVGTSSATRGNPLDLSTQDYKRMATVRFHEVDNITFSAQVTSSQASSSDRYFLFVARPVLRCAHDADGTNRRLQELAGPSSAAGRGPCVMLLVAAIFSMLQQLQR